MATKISSITIKGIRGAKNNLELPLNGKSILLYGDNGTGKSRYQIPLNGFTQIEYHTYQAIAK